MVESTLESLKNPARGGGGGDEKTGAWSAQVHASLVRCFGQVLDGVWKENDARLNTGTPANKRCGRTREVAVGP